MIGTSVMKESNSHTEIVISFKLVKSFLHNVEKWPITLLKSCGVLKYVWPFFNIHEKVNIYTKNLKHLSL